MRFSSSAPTRWEILTRVTLLMRIGELWAQQVGNGEKAFDAYSRCFRLDLPMNSAGLSSMRWRPILASGATSSRYTREAIEKGGLESLLTRELLMRVAVVYDEHLGKSDKAVEFFRRAQAIDPEDTVVLEALEKLYQGHQQWNELLEVFRKKVEIATDPKIREGMFFRMAKLWEKCWGTTSKPSTPTKRCWLRTIATSMRCAVSTACLSSRRCGRICRRTCSASWC